MKAAPMDRALGRLVEAGTRAERLSRACFWCGQGWGGGRRQHGAGGACPSTGRATPGTLDPVERVAHGIFLECREAYQLLKRHRRDIGDGGPWADFWREARRSNVRWRARWNWRQEHEALLRSVEALRPLCEEAADQAECRFVAAALRVVSGASREWEDALREGLRLGPSFRRWYRFAPILDGATSAPRQPRAVSRGRKVYRIAGADLLAG